MNAVNQHPTDEIPTLPEPESHSNATGNAPRNRGGRPLGAKDKRPRKRPTRIPTGATPLPGLHAVPRPAAAQSTDEELPPPNAIDGLQLHAPGSSIDGSPRWSHPLFPWDKKTPAEMRAYDLSDHQYGQPNEIEIRRRLPNSQQFETAPMTFDPSEIDRAKLSRMFGGGYYWIRAFATRVYRDQPVRQCTRQAFEMVHGAPRPMVLEEELEAEEEADEEDELEEEEAPPRAYAQQRAPVEDPELARMRAQLEIERQRAENQLAIERERARIQREEDAERRKAERLELEAANQRMITQIQTMATAAQQQQQQFFTTMMQMQADQVRQANRQAPAVEDPIEQVRKIAGVVDVLKTLTGTGGAAAPAQPEAKPNPYVVKAIEKTIEAFGGIGVQIAANKGMLDNVLDDDDDESESEEEEGAGEDEAPPTGAAPDPKIAPPTQQQQQQPPPAK